MSLPTDDQALAVKIAAHELAVALVELMSATGAADLAVEPEHLPDDMPLAKAQAAFDEVSKAYMQRAAMLLATSEDGAAALLKIEKGIAGRLSGFQRNQDHRGDDILADASGRIRAVVLAARGAPRPPIQQ